MANDDPRDNAQLGRLVEKVDGSERDDQAGSKSGGLGSKYGSEAGGSTTLWSCRPYVEPAALVTYLPPPPCAWRDLPYFLLRWSEQWNRASLRRFREKWNLPDNDPSLVAQFHAWTGWRRQVLLPAVSTLRRMFGWRLGTLINRGLEEIESALNRWLVRDSRRSVGRRTRDPMPSG